ncbi:hypothetical protein PGTUg99_029525 [Puccinia graminis f. sp. tritici]|uniref:Uncharacterized protein n=1 Tax=Puccinia graminis f. sp. tritici TaxID=56615 RepID=A0A5B0Q844_PUCGR|nr:hypothetical protein PGTUg99_029525 [Puccinia graminis f. sp. tritici]
MGLTVDVGLPMAAGECLRSTVNVGFSAGADQGLSSSVFVGFAGTASGGSTAAADDTVQSAVNRSSSEKQFHAAGSTLTVGRSGCRLAQGCNVQAGSCFYCLKTLANLIAIRFFNMYRERIDKKKRNK